VIWFDILIFAAVAAFLAYRLRSVLGERHGEERERSNPFSLDPANSQNPQRPVAVPPVDVADSRPEAAPVGPMADSSTLAGRLAQIQASDPNFSEKSFLGGARGAFEMIIGAFAREDTAALRPLLSDDVYDSFAAAIRARQAAKEKLDTKVVRIKSAELLDASMTLNTARVTVRFVSEQIQHTRDASGNVVEGDPLKSVEIIDRWTFSRNTRALDPNWQLAETRSEG
jgi:predicted lipid-binding transport protein (Tim44 family)